ncbi:MAG TPA: hypothetical protein VLA66_12095, partial [Thermoanaerobaculia bacterium]|nr:hypothetical protein [Thermoanaerobaculia bacterium]
TWAGSGYLLSMLSFYNLLTVAAWAPLVLWGVARGGRRGIAWGGLACGMMLLGGEPMSAALVVAPMALVAVERHRWRRGLATAAAVGALGCLVALPQLVATLRVLGFSYRAAHGLDATEVGGYELSPFRLLELVLPLPWGWPSEFGRFGSWSKRVTPDIPYVYSLHLGLVGLALALAAARRRLRWTLLAAGTLAAAWLAGVAPGLLRALTGGLFRYPQKLLLLFSLAAALLAGWGLDAARERRELGRWWLIAGGGLGLAGLVLSWRQAGFAELLRRGFATDGNAVLAATHAGAWIVGLLVGALLLALAGWGVRRGRWVPVVVAQLAGLLQLAPLVVTDQAEPTREPPPLAAVIGTPSALLPVPSMIPDWEPRLPYPIEIANPAGQARAVWFLLEPPFGVPLGFSYPIAPDLEGLTTPLQVFAMRNLQLADWQSRARWLRRLGVGWVVRFARGDDIGLERVAELEQFGVPIELLRIADPAPPVAWPEALAEAANPVVAWAAVAGDRVGARTALVARAVEHRAGGKVELVERSPDRWVIDVESEGGLLVVRTAWHPIWKARSESGEPLATQPADLVLLGVEVPAGRHRVTLEISAWPELLAAGLALAAACAALVAGARRRR